MNIAKQVEVLKLFKTNMIEFLDQLIEQFDQEGDLIMMRFFISEQIPLEDLMNRFILYILPYRDMILKKNEQFFLERDDIFGSSPTDKVIHFKHLYNRMDEDDKETLWAWFSQFISICDKYKQC
jgi:hypothetical protein